MKSLEEYELLIYEAVGTVTTWEQCRANILEATTPKPVVAQIKRLYERILTDNVVFNLSEAITFYMKERNARFIREFRDAGKGLHLGHPVLATFIGGSKELTTITECKVQKEQLKLLEEHLDSTNETLKKQVIVGNLRRLFERLATFYAPYKPEEELCNLLVAWFKSATMDKTTRDKFLQLKTAVILAKWKETDWTVVNSKDPFLYKFQQALKKINTSDFVRKKEISDILEVFLSDPKEELSTDPTGKKITITTRILFLSDLEDIAKRNNDFFNIYEVDIIAKNAVIADVSLVGVVWQGRNLCIVTDKMSVRNAGTVIDLSGNKLSGRMNQGNSASLMPGENGKDGNDGRAGGSSGNLAILTNEIINKNYLTVLLNGSDGEDGGDGQDGARGREGSGTTKDQLDETCITYGSLYRTSWSHFENWNPDSDWECTLNKCNTNITGGYVYKEYKHKYDGRVITYNLAGDAGYWYTTYEFFFIIKGSNGSIGGKGGRNGLGGEGGRQGEANISSISTGESYEISIEKSSGTEGKNGKCGRPGSSGKNGNDIAYIDRSASEASKYLYGGPTEKLKFEYTSSAEKYSRLSGYRKWIEEDSHPFIRLTSCGLGEGMQQSNSQERTISQRSEMSKAVCKATVVTESIVQQFNQAFEGDEVILQEACKSLEQEMLKSVEDEVESEEMVQQEIAVIVQHDDEKLFNSNDQSSKQQVEVTEEELKMQIDSVKNLPINADSFEKVLQTLLNFYNLESTEGMFDDVERIQKALSNEFDNIENIDQLFVSRHQYCNMNKENVRKFLSTMEARLDHKQKISKFSPKQTDPGDVDISIDFSRDELLDVTAAELNDDVFLEYSEPLKVKKMVSQFYKNCQFYLAQPSMLMELFKIFMYLIKHEEMFKPFEDIDLNWANPILVMKHLAAFLPPDQQTTMETGNEGDPMSDAFGFPIDHHDEAEDESEDEVKDEESVDTVEMEEEEVEEDKGKEKTKTKFGMFKKAVGKKLAKVKTMVEENLPKKNNGEFQDIKKVEKFIKKNEKELKKLAEKLDKMVVADNHLQEHFLLQKRGVQDKVLGGTSNVCLSSTSLIHIFNLSRQMLHFNMKYYKYEQLFKDGTFVPTKWFETPPKDEKDEQSQMIMFVTNMKDCFDVFKDLSFNNEAVEFMCRNGLRCSAFRCLLAESEDIHIRLFTSNGSSSMHLVEELNPTGTQKISLNLDCTGRFHSIAPNLPLREFRNEIVRLNSKCELVNEVKETSLSGYFNPAFKTIVEEWSTAVKAATGSDDYVRLIHDMFYVNGCHVKLFDLQFIMSTFIELSTNFRVTPDFIYNISFLEQDKLDELMLMVRLCPHAMFDFSSREIMEKVCEIEDSRIRALFGTKLHEMELTKDQLFSIISMMKHAGDNIKQLEKMHLKEWLEISEKQNWNAVGSLLVKFGTIGYYLSFLDTLKRKEVRAFKKMIDSLTENKFIIMEKLVAKVTFLIAANEISFTRSYCFSVKKLLGECMNDLQKVNLNYETDVRQHENIGVLVNENVQNNIIETIIRETGARTELWNLVFPEEQRSLSKLSELIVNPQDSKEQRKKRLKSHTELSKLMENARLGVKINGPLNHRYFSCAQLIVQIDDGIFHCKKIRLRDTQKMAVLLAATSKRDVISQVNTGEGKSYIISTLAIMRILQSDRRDSVDVITSSSVLAERDAEDQKSVYNHFGISVGDNCDEDIDERKMAYKSNVVYGDISRFQRDYLLQTFYKKNILGSRKQCNVIVDEVDNMLLDNGNNMLYLSHSVAGLDLLESLFIFIHKQINTPLLDDLAIASSKIEGQFNTQRIRETVLADMCGMITKNDIVRVLFNPNQVQDASAAWRILIQEKIIDRDGVLNNCSEEQMKVVETELKKECGATLTSRVLVLLKIVKNRDHEIRVPQYLHSFARRHLDEFIENAKKALFMKQDEDYVIDLDHTKQSSDLCPQVTIIDRNTGVDLVTSQWSEGLHQFLQLKHGCRLSPISLKAVFVSNVSYLKGYQRLNGFSGTLGSKEESLSLVELYGADLLRIPTWKPKNFYENVPQVATTEDQWIREVFDEICDQVIAKRSVLVICSSISEVDRLNRGMLKLYDELTDVNVKVKECFDNVITYTRQFDEFDFSENGYLPSRLIISTNLAGRGTDIKLSEKLIQCGGLHVIVSFLPDNSRIEDQAFGRASRCGQPGSGQIIAQVDKSMVSDGETPNIFKMKQFRDNAEVHRLQSLKKFYDYHTEVEETCLKMFREHCGDGCSGAYGSGDSGDLPSALQVIYFSLLDEWALWLDSKAEEIHRCAKECNNNEKLVIIDSVRRFLALHPVSKSSESQVKEQSPEVDWVILAFKEQLMYAYRFHTVDIGVSIKWIQCPQPLLTLALIQLKNENEDQAVTILNDVLVRFPDYGAEVMYYKAVISQKKIRRLKEHYLSEEQRSNGVRGYICDFFDKALTATTRVFSGNENWAPEMLIENVAVHHEEAVRALLVSRGLFSTRVEARQESVNLVQRLQHSPSNMQMKSTGFMDQHKQISAVYETVIGNIDDMVGHVVTPSVISDTSEVLSEDVLLYKSYLRSGILSRSVLQKDISESQYKLLQHKHGISPTDLKMSFEYAWKREGAEFSDGMPVISASELPKLLSLPSSTDFWNVLREEGCFLKEITYVAVRFHNIEKLKFLDRFRKSQLLSNPLLLQLSMTDLSNVQLYEVTEEMKNDLGITEHLTSSVTAGLITVEVFAILNIIQVNRLECLPKFDSLVEETLMEHFNIAPLQAMWLLDFLTCHGVLKRELVEYIEPKEKTEGFVESEKPAFKSEDSKTVRPVYRLVNKADFSMLPECIQSEMEILFSRSFAYGSALKALRSSLNQTVDDASIDGKHRILLPADPYLDLYNDMLQFGVCRFPRVISGFDVHYEEDLLPEGQFEKLKGKMGNILDASSNMVATVDYLIEKHVPASVEVRKSIANGLKQLAVVEKPRIWKWFLGIFVAIAKIVMTFVAAVFELVALAVTSLFEITALAPVGSTAYFLNLMRTMMRAFSQTEVKEQEEYALLRDYHESAVQKMYKQKIEDAIYNAIHRCVDSWETSMLKKMEWRKSSCCFQPTQATITDEVLEEVRLCIEESRFTDLIRSSLNSWSQVSTQKLQNIVYRQLARAVFLDKMDDHELNTAISQKTEELGRDVRITGALNCGYQLIVNDLNELFEKRGVSMRIQISEDRIEDNQETDDNDERSLKSMVNQSFKSLISSIQKRSVEKNLRSADLRLTNYLHNVRDKDFGDAKLDDESVEKKKVMHMDERTVATKMSSDFLARDLHNVFLRIVYHNPREGVIAHMLHYNYPLSAHCSTIVFDALFNVLDSKDFLIPKCTIRLNRENVVIFEYTVDRIQKTQEVAQPVTVDVSLIKDCYIISQKTDVAENSNSMCSLFEVLQDAVPRFSNVFMTGSTDFREALAEVVTGKKKLNGKKYTTTVKWNGTEALQWNKLI